MTVAELIVLLSQYSPDAIIEVTADYSCHTVEASTIEYDNNSVIIY